MNLELKIYELKKTSIMYDRVVTETGKPNEFIIVGEEMLCGKVDCFRVHQLVDGGLTLVKGLSFVETAFLLQKDDMQIKGDFGCEYVEVDIPKEYLTTEIIENIQRLN